MSDDANTPATSVRSLPLWLTVGAIVVTCLPVVVFRYLPMTDLPQHLAVASIIANLDDPGFGFAAYYQVEWTPYALVYVLTIALDKLVPLQLAMKLVVLLSVAAYPLGVLAVLRAVRKPPWLALLAIPLVYHRSVFWGFSNFDLSIGLALVAFALYIEPRKSGARDSLQALIISALAICHVYGVALLVALLVGFALLGGWRTLRARPWTLAPVLASVLVWVWSARAHGGGYGGRIDLPFSVRLRALPQELLGGYQDASEHVILGLFLLAWIALAWSTIPTSWSRMRQLTIVERLAFVAFLGNLLIYFLAPQSTWSAKHIHFRHAFLAFAFLPLLARDPAGERGQFLRQALVVITALAATLNAWIHLMAFDREARGFDRIVEALPRAPKVVYLNFDPRGKLVETVPYLHFAAYVQARKGGVISTSFPQLFWNLPVKMRDEALVPKAPQDFEWSPMRYDENRFGYFYDFALLRMPLARTVTPTPAFPYELVQLVPPWQLYKRTAPPANVGSGN